MLSASKSVNPIPAIILVLVVLALMIYYSVSTSGVTSGVPVNPPVAATETPKPAAAIPQESEKRKHLRQLCANEKYLAERRPLAEWTQRDFDAVRGCKQLGLY